MRVDAPGPTRLDELADVPVYLVADALKKVRINSSGTGVEYVVDGAGAGSVTNVSVVTANGVSGNVADPTTTPAITLTLGAITPTSVAASGTIAGSNLSGTNTGDQTLVGLGGVPTTRTVNALALSADITLVKGDIGLGNVDNTSDAAKPVSTATQTALDGKQPIDADLTTIAGLTATTDNFIISAASAWASRTPTQARASLALATTDSPQFAGINLGHASDTTIVRVSAGIISVEGVQVAMGTGTASGTNTGDQTLPTDATIATTDVATNNASTIKHGWFPKLPGGTTNFFREDGTWATPPGGSAAFPVGSVFIAVVSTNPATLLGYGTWSAFGAGKMMIGLDSGDADFDTAEEIGGAKTKTIAQANLPNISTGAGTAHTHTQDAHTHTQNAHTHVQDAHTHIITSQTATTGAATSYEHGVLDTSSSEAEATEVTGSTTATNQNATATNQNATATNQNESSHTHSLGGSGTALNVVNPYIVVYMWKRTA